MQNYVVENKKKTKKDPTKRKRSAKNRENDKSLGNESLQKSKTSNHRKSYSEVVRDLSKQTNKI